MKNIFYILKCTGSAKFIPHSSSNLVDDLHDGIQKIKCKYGHNEKCKTFGINYKDFECRIECINVEDDLVV